jgi:hypothetical protein
MVQMVDQVAAARVRVPQVMARRELAQLDKVMMEATAQTQHLILVRVVVVVQEH